MVVLNYTGGEINAKIVYYGPGVSGKTTNLEFIHEKTPTQAKGKMVSMKTQTDRTLFFDFLPLELGEINGYRTRFLLYTVPGQVYYNATRKLVLKGVDAVVFVADSSRAKLDENLESLRNLEQNLNEHGMTLDEIPWVIQYNKRDMGDAMPLAELEARLNPLKKPSFEAIANRGTGVYETFHGIATMVYRALKDRLERGELSTEIGDAAPAHHTDGPRVPGARPADVPAVKSRPAMERTPLDPPARAPRPAPQAAAPRTPPALEPPVAAPADAAGGEFEYDDHVDMMLREVDEPSAARQAPKAPSPPAPKAAPTPKAAPAAPARKTPAREPVAVAPAKAPVPNRRPSETADAKAQPRTAPQSPAPSPRAEAPADENLFAAIPDSPFDLELGRLPALDEASIASETAREEGPDEFVTDPMRRSEMKVAPAAPPVRAPESPRVAKEVREVREVHIATDVHTTQEIREVRVAVPLVLTRAQLEGGAPIRVVFDVKIVDE